MFDRYAMSFVGGAIGGGLGELIPNYKKARMMSQDRAAFSELIYAISEGKGKELIDTANKMRLGDKSKTARAVDSNGLFQ
jgi:hypothetical protein